MQAAEGPATAPILAYMHIHKTGGTSVEVGLKTIYRDRYRRLTATEQQGEAPDADVISGNFRLAAFDQAIAPQLKRPIALVTTVRDPVDRLRSLHAYLRVLERPEQRSRKLGVEDDDDINVVAERWLASSVLKRHGRRQCDYIGGQGTAEAAIRALEDRFVAVVTTANVDPLIGAIAEAAGAPRPASIHLQRSSSAKALDPGLAQRMREQCAPDDELVSWVRANEARLLEALRAAGARAIPRAG